MAGRTEPSGPVRKILLRIILLWIIFPGASADHAANHTVETVTSIHNASLSTPVPAALNFTKSFDTFLNSTDKDYIDSKEMPADDDISSSATTVSPDTGDSDKVESPSVTNTTSQVNNANATEPPKESPASATTVESPPETEGNASRNATSSVDEVPPKADNQEELEKEPLFLSDLDTDEAREKSRVSLDELDLESHSGYISVRNYHDTSRSHLFFWLIKAQLKMDSTPLLLWLNGSPGLSSMTSLLWQHGPLGIRFSKVAGKMFEFDKRESFWAKNVSVLYVDSPIGTGYSFSEQGSVGYRKTTEEVTLDLVSFLVQFLLIFPEFQSREIYIGGQEYSAKFAISLAYEIHSQTQSGGGPSFFNLKGVLLGSPLFDPPTQMNSFFDAIYNLGLLSFAEVDAYVDKLFAAYDRVMNKEYPIQQVEEGGNGKDMDQNQNQTTASEMMQMLMMNSFFPTKLRHFNLENWVTSEQVDHFLIWMAMTSPRLKSALHVGPTAEFSNFNKEVFLNFDGEFFKDYATELSVLMSSYKVLIYSGNYDLKIHNGGVESGILHVPWSQMETYEKASRNVWLGEGEALQGFYTHVGDFCRVVIHGAGHYAARDKAREMEKLVSDFVDHGCLK